MKKKETQCVMKIYIEKFDGISLFQLNISFQMA